jgi:hypothetical protein
MILPRCFCTGCSCTRRKDEKERREEREHRTKVERKDEGSGQIRGGRGKDKRKGKRKEERKHERKEGRKGHYFLWGIIV